MAQGGGPTSITRARALPVVGRLAPSWVHTSSPASSNRGFQRFTKRRSSNTMKGLGLKG
jgi:hypothetical protein